MPVTAPNFDDLILPAAQGGRKPTRSVMIEIEREMTEADLEGLVEGASPAAAPLPTVLSIKHAHHSLARLLVIDDLPLAEISLVTGYSPAYISTLKSDPAFKELLDYYATQKEAKFIDTLERMKTFGLTVLDELQRRFEANPEEFKKSELLNMTDLFLLRGSNGGGSGSKSGNGGAPNGGLNLTVSFVSAPPIAGPMAPAALTIEGEAS